MLVVRSAYRGGLGLETFELGVRASDARRLGLDQRLSLGIGWERAAFKSCRNKSISDGVSIRGVFEVESFRPGKAVVAESECLPPPSFKVLSMPSRNNRISATPSERP